MLKKEQFARFSAEVEETLKALASRYGAEVHCGNIKYDDVSFNIDLKVVKKVIAGKPYEQYEFEKHCGNYGFLPEDYKKQFIYKNELYTIVGFSPNASVRPVKVLNERRQSYKFEVEAVKHMLKHNVPNGINKTETVNKTKQQLLDELMNY